MTAKKELKPFELSGWVQVGVHAEIQAKNLKEAQKMFEEHNRGGNVTINWEEGNWESDITLDEDIKEVK
jgi:hypothetical protein